MNWWKGLEGRLRLDEPLRRHSSFRIGGKARFWYEPKDIEGLREALRRIKQHSIKAAIIGAGSNILFDDSGFKGACLRLCSPGFSAISKAGSSSIVCGAGAMLKDIVSFAGSHNMGGAEFLAGIPGTLGGAIIMNAGVESRNISDLVSEVDLMDYSGRVRAVKKENIAFAYRRSRLGRYIVLGAKLRLFAREGELIGRDVRRIIDRRLKTQDYSHPSAGCVFKNPPSDSAGRLIDICGLKGERVGGAEVSSRHANFIINRGRARSRDVIRLMNIIKGRVKDEFGICLEPEIKILGN
ncbi:MAG: UDP-N-acetylmuramate dehydrogenase [Candidatus Omnitrophica bacterium]|nr:UDP-N-acetylmuramate dehydrogenase [Candidatus Omnitrophota bacterium]